MTRDPRLIEAAEKAAAFNNGKDGFANSGKLNGYICEADPSHRIVTIDREPGVTPFTIQCVACEALNRLPLKRGLYRHAAMTSCFYRVPQDLEPTHEWYRPDSLDGLAPGIVDHLLKGGLTLRKIPEAATDGVGAA